MLLRVVVTVALPIVLSLIITPWVIKFAILIGATDKPDERKIHKHPMPRIGGVAVYLSFFLSLFTLHLLDPFLHVFHLMIQQHGATLTASLLLVMALGFWDDLRSLNPKQKFLVQILAATLVYMAGFRVSVLSHPLGNGLFNLGLFSYPVTVLWIVGITNAFNLIDGLDGLSSGVGAIASVTIFGISFLGGDYATAFMALALAGALAGFLRYNFNPARIFLGDCGSLFIGFTVAVLSIQGSTKGSVAVSILVPILALGLPIMDTLLSMIRRLIGSFLPQAGQHSVTSFGARMRRIFSPDKMHIHHKLIARGASHREVVLLLYLVSCLFGLGAFALTMASNVAASLVILVVGVATMAGVRQLRYTEMAILRNGVLLPLYKTPLIRRSLFQGFLDAGFIGLAFCLSYFIVMQDSPFGEPQRDLFITLGVVTAIQILVFWLTGIYKRTFQHLGLGDALKILKSVAIAALATWIFFTAVPHSWASFRTQIIMLDFYFLMTFAGGIRLSYRVLEFLFRRQEKRGKNVLIYGATTSGILTLQQLLNDNTLDRNPIGFIDDNPQLEGMCVNDYPVFGGHWKLQTLLRRYSIDEILLATDNMKPAVLSRLKKIAGRRGVPVRQARLLFDEVLVIPDGEPATSMAGSSGNMNGNGSHAFAEP